MYTLGDKVFFEGNFTKTSCIPFFFFFFFWALGRVCKNPCVYVLY